MRSDRLNVNSSEYNKEYSPQTLLEWNYISCGSPFVSSNQVGAAAVTAAGARVAMLFPGPEGQLYYTDTCRVGAFTAAGDAPQIEGTIPSADTNSTVAGLNIQLDHNNTDNVGMEVTLGAPHGTTNSIFTVGTDTGYIDATFFSAAWDDYDAVAIGFRKVEAYQVGHAPILGGAANADGVYSDFAAIGTMGTADKVSTMTDLNDNGTSVWTDSTQTVTDSRNHRFRIYLNSDGTVQYLHIGSAVAGAGALAKPTTTAAFTFDDGDELIPYITTHGAGSEDIPLFLKDIKIVRSNSSSWNPNT